MGYPPHLGRNMLVGVFILYIIFHMAFFNPSEPMTAEQFNPYKLGLACLLQLSICLHLFC
jgi:hypothetical protein